MSLQAVLCILEPSGNHVPWVGLLMGPSSAQLRMKPDKTVPGFAPVICNRLYKRELHFVSTWVRSHLPSHLESCSVVTGILKIYPRQMNHVAMAVSCCVC